MQSQPIKPIALRKWLDKSRDGRDGRRDGRRVGKSFAYFAV